MDSLGWTMNFLDGTLHYWEESCRAWCTKEGLEFTTGARLAHCIVDRLAFKQWRSPPPADILPRPSRDEAAWRALSEFRCREINLNLLQLAIVCTDYYVQKYLWQPMFLQEQDYRDDSSQLVNHPLHLHCRFSYFWVINLDCIRDELFYEEGLIDLTPSRMHKSTGTMSNNSASGLPNASVLKCNKSPPLRSALERIMPQTATSANGNLFHQPQPMRMASLCDLNNVLNVVRKLSGPQAQSSTVELVWTMATSTTSALSTHRSLMLPFLGNIPPTHCQELLILLCQCTFAVTDAKLREERLDHLSQLFWILSKKQNVQTEKAVRFLSTNTVEKTIRLLQEKETTYLQRRPRASKVLKEQVACKSLQDLCVLTVLEAVRGDARKVWSLEQLPEPLKQLFHIPFQETYEELKAGE